MPNMHELQLIYAVKPTLNEALYWAKGSGLFAGHWSSSLFEEDTYQARTLNMSSGLTSYDEKNTKSYVRAVSSF
jgi:hypothetical protein